MNISLTRQDFPAELEADSAGATLRLGEPSRVQPVATVSRRRGHLYFGLPLRGLGISFHRNGGVSFCGVPSPGGTTISWGRVRHRLRTLGRERRAIELGPIGIYIGRDF